MSLCAGFQVSKLVPGHAWDLTKVLSCMGQVMQAQGVEESQSTWQKEIANMLKKKVIHLSVLFLIWPHAVKRNCHPMSEPLAPACEPGTSHARMHFAVVLFFFREMSKKNQTR